VPALALLGWPWVRTFARRTPEPLETSLALAASLALGLAFVQTGAMLLGFTGALTAPAVIGWLALGGAASGLRAWKNRGLPSLPLEMAWGPVLAGAALLAGYLLLATVPPWYRDSMVYHLALPRAFAMAGGYVRPDDNIFGSFPLGYESIQAALHAFGSAPDRFPPFNPRLVGVWVTGGAALATAGLARVAGASSRLAGWAGVLLLLVPTLIEFGSSAYVEPYLVLLATLALAGVVLVLRGERIFLVPAAVCAGLAASVKYPGLAVVAILGVLLLASGLRRTQVEGRIAVRSAVIFAVVAALVGCPFYVRNVIERGNPFFPLAFGIFGGRGWDAWRDWAYGVTLTDYGAGKGAADWLLLPFRLFTWTDLVHGFEGSIGPVVGVGLVAGLALRRRRRWTEPTGALVVFALLWLAFWALSVQQARFFLLAVPPLLALGVAGIDRLGTKRKALGTLALAGSLAVSTGWALGPARFLWTRQHTGGWLAGTIARQQLLAQMLPESFAFEDELERLVPSDGRVWLVWMRGYTYYLRRPYKLDTVFEAYRFEDLLDRHDQPGETVAELRAEGITHVLVHERFFLVDGNADLTPGRTERLKRRFDALVADGRLRPTSRWGSVVLYAVEAGGNLAAGARP
jgi:4-amino-4-deoxy-L-arabinose transferase-like glycosyltransferase